MMTDVDPIRIYSIIFTVLLEPKFKISNVTKTKLPQVECKYYRSYLKYYIPKQILREQNNKYKN